MHFCKHVRAIAQKVYSCYSKDICLKTMFLLFQHLTKELFVSPANSYLVGILIATGDVPDIFVTTE